MRPSHITHIRPALRIQSLRHAFLPMMSLFGVLLALPGCALFTDAPHYRGIEVTPHDLAELTPGISTEADVQALLGPPTFQEQFNPNHWVYLSQITKMRIGQTEGVNAQHVVVMDFNDQGVLSGINQKTKKAAVTVAMDPARTPVPGGKAGFIQQLVGGVGSYNPGIGGAGAGGAGAGAGGLGGGAGDIGGTSNGSGF
ncbi:MAG: outer membrane protein assembly factor BamE [Acidocella sp.]|nr:outer membrane protein assembly factor BamE [Acidocella sp.]